MSPLVRSTSQRSRQTPLVIAMLCVAVSLSGNSNSTNAAATDALSVTDFSNSTVTVATPSAGSPASRRAA